jgi:hypothetical protein
MYLHPQMEAYCDRMIYIVGQLANLRADIMKGNLTDAHRILLRASATQSDIMAWIAAAPAEFRYATIKHQSARIRFGSAFDLTLFHKQYHLYHDLWVCHTWNHYRCARILICEILFSCFRRLAGSSRKSPAIPKEVQMQFLLLHKTSREFAMDICASAPFHFGLTGRAVLTSQVHIGGMLLLLPLAIAAGTEHPGQPMRKWVSECLTLIGNGLGIDQAFAIREMLDCESGLFDGLEDIDGDERAFPYGNRAGTNRFLVGTWGFMLNSE